MKTSLILTALALSAASAVATVTVQFSSATVYASNFANAAGAGGSTLVWGIVIDTAGDGFDFSNPLISYKPGSSLTAGGQVLTSGNDQVSDDFLYIATTPMSLVSAAQSGTDGALQGMNRVTSLANIPFGSFGIGVGDAFAIVWFDETAVGATTQGGDKFGAILNPAFTIAADSTTTPYTSVFAGAEPLQQMNFSFVPEPSSALLGLLGAVGLLRRRR